MIPLDQPAHLQPPQCTLLLWLMGTARGEQVLTYCSLNIVRPLYLRQYIVIWGNVFFIFSYLILFRFVAFYIREEILLERLMRAIIKFKENKNLLRLKNINSDHEL